MQRLATTGRCGYDWFSTTSSLRAALGEAERRSGATRRSRPGPSRRARGSTAPRACLSRGSTRTSATSRGRTTAGACWRRRPPPRSARPAAATPGAHSLTVVRHPFARAVSAFYYRGHSPNYDVFDLRPGLWVRPWIKRADVNLREYLALPEYANVLTKMFGATCPRDATCAESESCGCSRTQRCHAYRNASLGEAHVAAAVANLRAHRAFGVQEAFNASARLAGAAFGFAVESRDLRRTARRRLAGRCSPSRVMRSDPAACRAAFAGHALDVRVFEAAHREFCGRLEAAGLRPGADAGSSARASAANCATTTRTRSAGPRGARGLARLEELRRPCRKDGAWWALKPVP
ncbi:acid phosphatase [Aureococcus anophagefferens]|nr:acid phosphatase [Aureococcus anophagefferens]